MNNPDRQITRALHIAGDSLMPLWRFLSLYGGFFYAAFFMGLFAASLSQPRIIELGITSLFITTAITMVLRYIVRRPRPKFMYTGYVPWLNDYSFPSVHAALVFSIGIIESWLFLTPQLTVAGMVLAFVAMILAVLIALSRVMLGVHYISDIVAGAALGTVTSLLTIYFL